MTHVRDAADLRALSRLHETASLCARDGVEPKVCLTAVLAAAIELTGASKGNIQLLDASGALKILVHRGFEAPFLEFFGQVDGATTAACGTALQRASRVLVPDVVTSGVFAGTPALRVLLDAGVRAVQSTPLVSSKGRVLGMISTHFDAPHEVGERELRLLDLLARQAADLLERVRSEEALLHTADDLLQTLHTAAIGLTRCSRDLRYVTANLAYAQIMNVSREEILGRPIVDVLGVDAFERIRPYIERVLAGEQVEYDVELPRRGGATIYLHVTYAPWTERGAVTGWVASVSDVTERWRAEQALRESEARNQDLLRAIPDLMFLQDKDGVYLDFHASDVSDLLVPPAQFLGKNMRDVLPGDLAERIATCFQQAGSNEPSVMEYALQLDQGMRHFEARIIRGQQDTFLSIVRDITERKLAEESLQRAQTELALATRRLTMGALAASIAHEISQPLTAIISNANAGLRLLERGQLEELKATFEDVVKDGQRAASVMHQTRALFTERAPRTESLDLNQVILNVVAVVRHEIFRNRVVLSTDLADGVPTVHGDRTQLQQVMLNLIMNGLEAMAGVDDRPCELVIRSRKSPSGEVVVSVSDSGVGFDPGDGERLFDAFFTTKPTGMGMGLSISRSIVSSLGGELWAAPNTPYGSTFHFRLPTSHGADAGQKATGPPGRPDVTPLEAVLRRDRAVIAAALVAIAALAWALVVRLAPSTVSAGMAMPGMSGMEAGAALGIPWLTGMWAVMMVAMMLPSATPTILMFGNVTRRRQLEGRPAVPVAVFTVGYLAVWAFYAMIAAVATWELHRLALLSPSMAAASPALAGGLLIAAGVYQWLPIKGACLSHCRSPLHFFSTGWREGVRGAVAMGVRHGSYCVGCCWLLMALLFVAGVMNLLWVSLLAGLVLLEKLLPRGDWIGRVVGVALVVWGVWVISGRYL